MKRLLSVILVLTLALSIAAPAFAAGSTPAISAERAIGIAKAAFTVPADCDQFTSNYEEYGGRQTWALTWRSKDGNKSVYVAVDAATGAIRNYWRALPTSGAQSRLPKISREQGKAIADALIAKLQPTEAQQIRYVEPVYQPAFDLAIGVDYRWSYNYERVVNGITFPENTFSVQINGTTGEVESYSFTWTNATFPSLTGQLTAAEANAIFGAKIGLKPIWWRPSPENGVGKPLRLVYTADGARKMIDALTGDIIETTYWIGGEAKSLGGDQAANTGLTPAEQIAVDELAKLVSVDTAEAAARKVLGIGDEFKRASASLVEDYQFPENGKSWSFGFSAGEGTTDVRWASAEVDAKTGAVLGFYLPYPSELLNGKAAPAYTREQAMLTAEAYVKAMDADKAGQVEFVPPTYKIDDTHAIDYTFDFVRVHDGIQFPANKFQITVSAYDNKVYCASLHWADLAFPTVTGTLSKAAAEQQVLTAYPLKLSYQTVTINDQQVIRPVYSLNADSTMFSGITGEPIDYKGDVVKKYVKPSFTDIAGAKYEAEIRVLIDLGVIDSTSSTYRPNDQITTAEFLKLITSVSPDHPRPVVRAGEPWAKVYIAAARDDKYVLDGEALDENKIVTRADAARWLVRALDLEFVSKLGIYQLPTGDSKVTADRGYLSLAWGLGMLQTEGASLKPLQNVTRGEAAALIVRMLRVVK